ncbi:hypothetical protein FZ934_13525 [Rhizobium grahamii]|uniref:Uncharacterized protein n=1 Tax=Rhizobium grahamii TaxID=1120045 RepID=A0A5Q0CC71_9HYPH|nr:MULTISPECIES: hypothetical protein [Rhizobium]QFY61329.1 hypothetical protein FZ934_13525 [Rhizobium grahamii]QRM49522.1 hypothetical protein F3Y33_09365 [Rhizobium sp. BG6]
MSPQPTIDEMSEQERLDVLERLLAHLKFGAKAAAAVKDFGFEKKIHEVELLLKDHRFEIARGSGESSELVLSKAIGILSSYYLKHGYPGSFGRPN